MNVSAVIGANYGDEGKGHMVHNLSGPGTLVVRFNGGAQAGHTVVDGDRRHVFHHFGSGTLRNAWTFLSRFFLLNPMIYVEEWKELNKLGYEPGATVDLDAPITTPFDMMLNREAEHMRGEKRHGSCGMGIYETVMRENFGISLIYADLISMTPGMLSKRLEAIRDEWVPTRARRLGVKELPAELNHPGLIEHFLDDLDFMKNNTRPRRWCPELKSYYKNIVFEGAQGLRLDSENVADYPHVSGTRTGLTNVRLLLQEARITDATQVYYVTRPYITRHGAGPLSHELSIAPGNLKDETNVTNKYQGKLRFGWFDVDEFVDFVLRDIGTERLPRILPTIVFSCIDQMHDEVPWLWQGAFRITPLGELVARLKTIMPDGCGFATMAGPDAPFHTL